MMSWRKKNKTKTNLLLILTLSCVKNWADEESEILVPENRVWHSMQMDTFWDNLPEYQYFLGKRIKKQNSISERSSSEFDQSVQDKSDKFQWVRSLMIILFWPKHNYLFLLSLCWMFFLLRNFFREFRNIVIDMVLATDMSYHFQQIKNMKNLLSMPEK